MIIDVSEHNGKLNWEKLKPQIEGAIIRCGFGSNYKKQDDAYFSRNVSECERLGIPYGVYIYSYANTEAKAKSEAEHVKRLIEGHKLAFPVFYDLEEEKYSSFATKAANAWLKAMEGYDVGIYANVNWWKNYLKNVKCDKKWVAYWGKTKPSISGMVLWQYSSTGKISGVSGNFDLNQNISLVIPTPEPQPTPEPTPTPQPEPQPQPTPAAQTYKVKTISGQPLALRSAAKRSSYCIVWMPNGSTVTVDKTVKGESVYGSDVWAHATYKGKTGYCTITRLKKV